MFDRFGLCYIKKKILYNNWDFIVNFFYMISVIFIGLEDIIVL